MPPVFNGNHKPELFNELECVQQRFAYDRQTDVADTAAQPSMSARPTGLKTYKRADCENAEKPYGSGRPSVTSDLQLALLFCSWLGWIEARL